MCDNFRIVGHPETILPLAIELGVREKRGLQ
jgi:hypothetical protein